MFFRFWYLLFFSEGENGWPARGLQHRKTWITWRALAERQVARTTLNQERTQDDAGAPLAVLPSSCWCLDAFGAMMGTRECSSSVLTDHTRAQETSPVGGCQTAKLRLSYWVETEVSSDTKTLVSRFAPTKKCSAIRYNKRENTVKK